MKRYINLFSAILTLSCFAVLHSCTDKIVEDDEYIAYDLRVSDVSLGVMAQGGEYTVTVFTDHPEGWSLSELKEGGWIKEVSRTEKEIVFLAEENTYEDERSLQVTFSAGALKRTLDFTQEGVLSGLQSNFHKAFGEVYQKFSPTGRYIVTLSNETTEDGEIKYIYKGYNTLTNESSVLYEYTSTQAAYSVRCISDTGILFLSLGTTIGTMIVENGVESYPVNPEGYTYSHVTATNSDGSVRAGWCISGFAGYQPIKWVNGVPEILDYPNEYRTASSTPMGAMAEGVSPDGKILYGRLYSYTEAIYWDEEGNVDYLGPVNELVTENGRYADARVMYNANCDGYISSGNRYMACPYYGIEDFSELWQRYMLSYAPSLYDFETGEFYYNLDLGSGYTYGATDEGEVFFAGPYSSAIYAYGYVWNTRNNTVKKASEWVFEKFNTIVPEDVLIYRYDAENDIAIGVQMDRNSSPITVYQFPIWIHQPSSF